MQAYEIMAVTMNGVSEELCACSLLILLEVKNDVSESPSLQSNLVTCKKLQLDLLWIL